MKSIKLGFIFEDKEYAAALAGAAACRRGGIDIAMYGEAPQDVTCDLYLTDKEYLGDGIREEMILYVSEKRDDDAERQNRVYKYSDIHRIMQRVRELCGDSERAHGNGGGGAELIAFAGCCGGAGTSAVALTAARVMAMYHGKKVLYLELSAFKNDFIPFDEQGYGIDRYVYSLRYRGKESTIHSNFVRQDKYGVYHFSGERLNPAKQLGFEDLSMAVECISEALGVDAVCVDMGADFTPEHGEFLEIADSIAVVHSRSISEERKEMIMRFAGERRVPANVFDVVNFSEYQGLTNPDEAGPFYVYEARDSFFVDGQGHRGMDMDRSFGISVSEFTRLLL